MADDALEGALGDGSSVASPGGNQSAVPGGQTPANPGSAVEAKLDKLLAENASMRDRLERLDNDFQARQRRERMGREPAAPAPATGVIDTTKIPDGATREAVAALKAREDARVERERLDAEQARAKRATDRLKALLDAARPARREKVERLLKPYVKEGIDGTIIYDDGVTVMPIEDVVRQECADDIFKPEPTVPGTDTPQGLNPRHALPQTQKAAELALAAKIINPEARYARQMEIERKYKQGA